MKLLLFLVSVIAFLTVNCSDFPDGHQEHSLTDRLQQLEETRLDDGTENSGSSELNFPDGQQEHNLTDRLQQLEETSVDDGLDDGTENSGSSELNELMKEKKGQPKSELQRSRCKSRNACVVMGGFCVTNVTHCEGRLVADGCKGKDCQCCIPEIVNTCRVEGGENSTLWQKFDIVEAAITAIVDEGNDNITRDMEMSIQNLTMSMKNNQNIAMYNLTEANSNLELKLNNMMSHQGDMEMSIHNLTMSMNNMMSHQGDVEMSIQNMTMKMNNMMSHQGDMESKFQALERELKSKIDNMTNILINNLTIVITGCPLGFFRGNGSNQCFKFFGDTRRSWSAADQKCKNEHLVLAKTDTTNPEEVRRYLIATYGLTSSTWIGAKGDNSEVRWQRGNSSIPSSSSYWYSYRAYSSYCLMLTTGANSAYVNKPYFMYPCTSSRWTLCEKV